MAGTTLTTGVTWQNFIQGGGTDARPNPPSDINVGLDLLCRCKLYSASGHFRVLSQLKFPTRRYSLATVGEGVMEVSRHSPVDDGKKLAGLINQQNWPLFNPNK